MNNYILTNENAVFYECGYSCDNEIFIKFGNDKFFITDARYTIEAREFLKDTFIVEADRGLIKDTRILLRKLGIKDIFYDPFDFSVAKFEALSQNLGINFKPSPNFSQKKRMIKTQDEIKILKEAAKFGALGFDKFSEFINQNSLNFSEKELFFHAQNILKDGGNLDLSFSPIIGINKNAAKAHALPSDDRLKMGDLLLFDAGVRYKKYCSDRTRTAFAKDGFKFEKEQKFQNAKMDEIYHIVKEAQELAIKAVRPGVLASEIDLTARNFITKAGFGKEFFHSTGHGVGLDIHELPIISPKSQTKLEEGMVFSIEPGIYIADELGVRIEDVVVVTKDGCEIL